MKNSLTVNWIAPASGKGELTFSVVDHNQKHAVAFYPASQLEHGAASTSDQVLEKFIDDLNLTVNWIAPASGKGEFTFSVVDNDKKITVGFYPASQLDSGTESTSEQVLNQFSTDIKLTATPA